MNYTEWIRGSTPLISSLDLVVFTVMLSSSAFIGCYFGCCSGRKQSADEYLMGGKTMSIVPISLSLVASSISGITVLGVPSEIYRYGTQYWLVVVAMYFLALTACYVFIPVYTELQLDSCYQYLALRFNTKVRRFASFLYAIFQVLVTPIVIYVPALAFSQVTGINVHFITPVTCIVCIFYTTLGGLRAVVWADTLQTVLMFIATIAVFILGTYQVGGWSEVWKRSEEGKRLEFFNFDPDPFKRHTFWTVLLGSYFLDVARFVTNQGMIQRVLAVPTIKDARWCLFWYSIGFGFIQSISIVTGLVIYAYYFDCDPLISKRVKRPDQLLPLLVLETTGHIPGLSGLFLAGVFSAALSTMSTSLNALSGVLVDDLLEGYLPNRLSRGAWLRVASVSIGALCVALVFIVEHLGGVLQVTLSLSGMTIGSMFGIFALGMFFPRATSKGAMYGAVAGLIIVGGIVLATQAEIARGSLKYRTLPVSVNACPVNVTIPADSLINEIEEAHPLYRLSYLYYSPIGTIIVLFVGLLVSNFWRDDEEDEMCDPRFLSPVIRHLYQTKSKFQAETQPINLKLTK